MKKNIGIIFGVIIAVLAIVLGVIFLAPDKETDAENPNENTSQSDEKDALSVENLAIMNNTLDLHSVNLYEECNIRGDYDISDPYPTALGCVYLVREHLSEKSLTYLFVTTQDTFIYEMISDISSLPLNESRGWTYELYTENIDNESGEEIIVMLNTGGNGGRGYYTYGIYKITDKDFVNIELPEDGYKITLQKPFEYVITNEYSGASETVKAIEKFASDFEEDGTPIPENTKYISSMIWGLRPIDFDKDGIFEIVKSDWSSISKEAEEVIDFETTYKYDCEKNEFVVSDAKIMVNDDDFVFDVDFNYRSYLDLNGDGTDELITFSAIDKENVTSNVYVFADGKVIHAGEIPCTNRSEFYFNEGVLTEVIMIAGEIRYNTYKLVDNKLVADKSDVVVSADQESETYEKFGEILEWDIY